MSAPTKLRGGQDSEITRLKALWRGLSDDARAYWQELFVSDATQAQIRKELAAKLKINLRFDKQLTAFRQWEAAQQELDLKAERMEEDARRLKEEFGDWTLEQIREEVLRRSYAQAIAEGDFSAGRKTIVQDLNVKKVSLDERKLVLLEKKAAAFDQAKEVIESQLSPEEQKARLKEILK